VLRYETFFGAVIPGQLCPEWAAGIVAVPPLGVVVVVLVAAVSGTVVVAADPPPVAATAATAPTPPRAAAASPVARAVRAENFFMASPWWVSR